MRFARVRLTLPILGPDPLPVELGTLRAHVHGIAACVLALAEAHVVAAKRVVSLVCGHLHLLSVHRRRKTSATKRRSQGTAAGRASTHERAATLDAEAGSGSFSPEERKE